MCASVQCDHRTSAYQVKTVIPFFCPYSLRSIIWCTNVTAMATNHRSTLDLPSVVANIAILQLSTMLFKRAVIGLRLEIDWPDARQNKKILFRHR